MNTSSKSRTAGSTSTSARYAHKQAAIVEAATLSMNAEGVTGMTLAAVGRQVGLGTSSVTYYFRKRDQLAAAVFAKTLDRIEALVADAADAPTPQARVDRYLRAYFDLHRRVHQGDEAPLAILSEMRTLDDDLRVPLLEQYVRIFRVVRAFFGSPGRSRPLDTARAHVLTESMYWLPVWLFDYAYGDFDDVRERMLALFTDGLALPGAEWSPLIVEIDRAADMPPVEADFMRVATRLVSDRGYRGASVDRIATELHLTKGSFYHHFETKEDLVLGCFRHSYATIATVLNAEVPDGQWRRLTSAIATLVHLQLQGEWPLLRTTALQTLPEDLRSGVFSRSDRMTRRVAGIISDGIAEGSVRPVDPMVAGHAILPALNAAYELRSWGSAQTSLDEAVALYASTLAFGLFDDRLANKAAH